MLLKAILGISAISIASGAIAQTQTKKKVRIEKPAYAQTESDTLTMTCAQIGTLIKSKPQGIVLKTGANRWDKYVHDAEACGPVEHNLTPAFVRTKDNMSCHIGFTCEDTMDAGD